METLVLSQSYIIYIGETWWDKSCDWSAGIEEYQLYRMDRQGRKGGGVVLCMMEILNYTAVAIKQDWQSGWRNGMHPQKVFW